MGEQKGCVLLMRQVSTQEELPTAITAEEKEIEVTADFNIDALQEIAYATTITSAEGGSHTLTKADGYNESLFAVINSGSLTLQNLILDGAKGAHASTGGAAALVTVRSGTLILDTGSVLQNNNSYVGGAVSCETSKGLPCTVTVQGNAAIRDNYAASEGGGSHAKFTVPGSSLLMEDDVEFSAN